MYTAAGLFLVSLIEVVVFISMLTLSGRSEPQPASIYEPAARRTLRVSGNFEAVDTAVSFNVAGRIKKRFKDEGDWIRAGDPVAEIDDSELRHEMAIRAAELAEAEAALSEILAGPRPQELANSESLVAGAQAKLDELKAGARREDVATAEATIRREKVEFDRLEKERNTYHALAQTNAISLEARDLIDAQFKTSKERVTEAEEHLKLLNAGARQEELDQARAALKGATAHHELIKAGPRNETIDRARANVRHATEVLELAKIRLGFAKINAPATGMILSKEVEAGEYVAPGTPVLTIGDLAHIWLRAYIDESDLGHVKLGQEVLVTCDSFPEKEYKGTITFISSQSEFTPKIIQTEKERVKLVYRVKIALDNTSLELKPGMPADARIQIP